MSKHDRDISPVPVFKSIRTAEPDWRSKLTTKPVKLGRGSSERVRRAYTRKHAEMARAQGRV